MSRPNILIIMPDQHRGDCLSCAGHPVVQTPHIDRLASQGVRFSHAYTSSPVCMSARNSFLTGIYSHNHSQWNNCGRTRTDVDSYLRHVKESGYHTCHIGKSHLYPHTAGTHIDDMKPFMQQLGWDEVFETTGPYATVVVDSMMTDRWRELGCLDTFREDYARRAEIGPVSSTWPSPMPQGEHMDDYVGRLAVDYIDRYEDDDPFLLFVGFGGPHDPWDPPADWAAKYDPADMPEPKSVTTPGDWVPELAAKHQRTLQEANLPPETVTELRALYYAKVSHIDSWIGQILDTLARRGMVDDTAIIFWSDHGEMLGDKGRIHKQVFYDEAARVPMIIKPAGRFDNAGAVCERLVSQIDIFPTILDIANCSNTAQVFGRSLTPLLQNIQAPHHDAVFSEVAERQRGSQRTMIRDERYKMVVNNFGVPLKLYDMEVDPDEDTNLVGRNDMKEVTSQLQSRLLSWLLDTQLVITPLPFNRFKGS